jgi:hypothetical protein
MPFLSANGGLFFITFISPRRRLYPLSEPEAGKGKKIFTPLNSTKIDYLTGAKNPACPVGPEDRTGVNPA